MIESIKNLMDFERTDVLKPDFCLPVVDFYSYMMRMVEELGFIISWIITFKMQCEFMDQNFLKLAILAKTALLISIYWSLHVYRLIGPDTMCMSR